MTRKLVNHKNFKKNEIKFGELKKDNYGNIKSVANYAGNNYPIVRVSKSCFTFGIQSIPLFSDKTKQSGKFQMTISPFKNGRSAEDSKEREFQKLFDDLRSGVLDHIMANKNYFKLGKLNRDMVDSLIDPIFWQKKNDKGEVIDNDEEGRTYLYLRLISLTPSVNGIVEQDKVSPKIIKTFFDDGKGNTLDPQELFGAPGKIYMDVKIRGYMYRQGKFKIQLEMEEASFIKQERERLGDRVIIDDGDFGY